MFSESGAIVEYILRRHANGRLAPATDSKAYDTFSTWLHYTEGSAMLPLMLRMYVGFLGDAGRPLHPRIKSEIATHFGYVCVERVTQNTFLPLN